MYKYIYVLWPFTILKSRTSYSIQWLRKWPEFLEKNNNAILFMFIRMASNDLQDIRGTILCILWGHLKCK